MPHKRVGDVIVPAFLKTDQLFDLPGSLASLADFGLWWGGASSRATWETTLFRGVCRDLELSRILKLLYFSTIMFFLRKSFVPFCFHLCQIHLSVGQLATRSFGSTCVVMGELSHFNECI